MSDWRPYVPVAERRARATRAVARKLGKGRSPQPVVIEGRKIARTFWGVAWCEHLLKFSDFANRLPRGATYARNGSVCHLEIDRGVVEAFVAGSFTYRVRIVVKPLGRERWEALKTACKGSVGSLIELLEGRVSDAVMRSVTDKADGLFPGPSEIEMDCTCPDWAGMCKHVAAVMYGVGARLDSEPELLFALRGVDHAELVASGNDAADAVAASVDATGSSAPRLPESALGDIFGIALDTSPPTRRPARGRQRRAAAGEPGWTGDVLRTLRIENGLDEQSLAIGLGVSTEKIVRWEASTGALRLGARDRAALDAWRKYIEEG